MRKYFLIGLLIFAFVPQVLAQVIHDSDIEPKYVPGELIVQYKSSANTRSISPELKRLHNQFKLKESKSVFPTTRNKRSKNGPNSRIFKFEFEATTDNMEDIAALYQQAEEIELAHPNYLWKIEATPNDTNFADQYAHTLAASEAAWDITTGNTSTVIAIIDTGVEWDHPDLAANIWNNAGEIPGNATDDDGNGFVDDIRGWDFVDFPAANRGSFPIEEDLGPPDNNPMDVQGHGTAVAGVAAAVGNNATGVAGVCWNCKIMPLRVGISSIGLSRAYITSRWVLQAIEYARNNGADVINLSIIDSNRPKTVEDAINRAIGSGIIVVAAAGNQGTDGEVFPASLPGVIAVAASNQSDERSIWGTASAPLFHPSESNYGSWVDVAAPGTNIRTTAVGDTYANFNGTSVATPFVAGIAALLSSHRPGFSPADVLNAIHSTTDQITADKYIGSGRVDVERALQMTAIPTAEITSPTANLTMGGSSFTVTGTAAGANFFSYRLQYGSGPHPSGWNTIATSSTAVTASTLGTWNLNTLSDNRAYTLRLEVTDTNGNTSVAQSPVYLQRDVQGGWPQELSGYIGFESL